MQSSRHLNASHNQCRLLCLRHSKDSLSSLPWPCLTPHCSPQPGNLTKSSSCIVSRFTWHPCCTSMYRTCPRARDPHLPLKTPVRAPSVENPLALPCRGWVRRWVGEMHSTANVVSPESRLLRFILARPLSTTFHIPTASETPPRRSETLNPYTTQE